MKSIGILLLAGAIVTGMALAALAQRIVSTVSPQTDTTIAHPGVPPYIVHDTQNDSPGTNIVTRVVTFSAQIGGSPAPALQWEVNRGKGFVSIAGATNATYRINNAQVEHSGLYALFATNRFGSIHSTPEILIVSEGVD